MKTGILISVLLYELLLIGGMGIWLARRAKARAARADEFTHGGRQLPLLVVAATLALTVLGSPHILGIFEMSWHIGATAMWFSIAHVILLAAVCLGTGIWARRLHLTTVPELLEILYGPGVRLAVSCVMAGAIFGVLTLETQGLGILLSTMTGWSISSGALAGGVLGILYVVLAGLKEVAWINVVNAAIMYVGLILATIYLAMALPGGNFDSVATYYIENDSAQMLSIFGSPDIMFGFGFALVFALIFSMPINQVLLQTAMAAKNEKTIRRSLWIAAPVNGMFGVFVLVIGLTAKALPEFNTLGPKLAAPTMLLELLPSWLVVLLLACFLAAILSSFAMTALGPATILTNDIYKRLYNQEADERRLAWVTRLLILMLGLIAMGIASYLPPILAAIAWVNGWLIPILWLFVAGLFWRHSATAAAVTIGVTWAVNSLWTFTPLPEWIGLPGVDNSYIVVATTLIVGVTSSLTLGDKPAYVKTEAYKLRLKKFEGEQGL